ncbi:MAG TPA: prolyl oligopeptidase family serine peptidase [Gemmatimonadaceae bacterium]|nr:prolyl oligopeptidase family serine peptidase [Gemmatimonadaceae bacterium]
MTPPTTVGARSALVTLLAIGCTTAVPSAGAQVQQGRIAYPATKTIAHVDDYFGRKVADPYRWMEDLNSPGVAAWVKSENAITEGYLAKLPLREHFRTRITELWNYPKVSLPFREAGQLFYTKNSGLQRQSVWYTRASFDAPERVVIDPNVLSPDGSVALSLFAPSPDGRHFAYGQSQGGSDWSTVYVRELATGKQLADTVRWLKFSGVSWTKDGKGFFYSRFPTPAAGKELEGAVKNQMIYYHLLGTPQSADRLIYQRKDHPDYFLGGNVTEDGKYLLIYVVNGTDPHNRLYVADLGDPAHPNVAAPVRALFDTPDAAYTPIGNVGSTIYLSTDNGAPKYRIVAFDVAHPDKARWRTVVPEAKNVIDQTAFFKGHIAVNYLEDVKSNVHVFTLDGAPAGTVSLPGVGTVGGLSGRADSPDLFYAFTSPLYPSTPFRFDPASGKSTAIAQPQLKNFDPAAYETKEVFATSKDGTKIPVFITAKKGIALDGSHPTILYGYGGFDINMTPTFQIQVLAWLEQGGIYATANMRGGGEYGEEWHRAGMFDKKQNVFDDFIAAAEYLVANRYTSPSKLGIEGDSNGGLLVGAVEEQRPDLFAVALPGVGVMDMLRYDKFTGGQAWAAEYGSSSDSTAFKYLIKYSPLQNVKPGTCYPATLLKTADHDDRVVPSHTFKFTATMQQAQGCARPVLVRVQTQGSHGYLPTDKRIAELADGWAFAWANMQAPAAKANIVP